MKDTIEIEGKTYEYSFVDAANPVIFVHPEDFGVRGSEIPSEFNALPNCTEICRKLEIIRGTGAILLGFATDLEDAKKNSQTLPKIAFATKPVNYTAGSGKTIFASKIDMAHPSDALPGKPLKELAFRVEIGLGLTIFPGSVPSAGSDLAAQMMGQQLAAIANTQNGNAKLENSRIHLRRGGVVYAIGPAGKDDANGGVCIQIGQRGGIGLYLAVDIALADTAGNELVILPAKVQNDDFLHISRPPGIRYCPARRIR